MPGRPWTRDCWRPGSTLGCSRPTSRSSAGAASALQEPRRGEEASLVFVRLLRELTGGRRHRMPFRVVVHMVIGWTVKGIYEPGRVQEIPLGVDEDAGRTSSPRSSRGSRRTSSSTGCRSASAKSSSCAGWAGPRSATRRAGSAWSGALSTGAAPSRAAACAGTMGAVTDDVDTLLGALIAWSHGGSAALGAPAAGASRSRTRCSTSTWPLGAWRGARRGRVASARRSDPALRLRTLRDLRSRLRYGQADASQRSAGRLAAFLDHRRRSPARGHADGVPGPRHPPRARSPLAPRRSGRCCRCQRRRPARPWYRCAIPVAIQSLKTPWVSERPG